MTRGELGKAQRKDEATVLVAGPRFGLLCAESERYSVRPPETILRRVFSPSCLSLEMYDVVFLHHSSGRTVGAVQEIEPTARSLIGQIVPPVAPYPFDGQPLERRPAVGAVPLLPRREVRGDEAAGHQEVTLQSRRDALALIVARNSEVERRGRCERRPIRHERAGAPAPIEEEAGLGVVHRENRLPAGIRPLFEPAEERVIAPPVPDKPPGRDGALGIIEEAVEIDRDQLGRLERAQVPGIAHPAAREVPTALCGCARVAIEFRAERLG